jgi:tetratricopeptide (TPR) repeat protein
MKNQWTVSGKIASSLGSAALFTLSCLSAPAFAGDPFQRDEPHAIGDRTEEAFNAMFRDGNYDTALTAIDRAIQEEPNEPMAQALKASLIYLNEGEWSDFKTYATNTRTIAEALAQSDPIRSHLYTAVGHFLEGAYAFEIEGPVRGTPAALAELRQVFQHLDAAEQMDSTDPELNIIKGFMDLLLAVNLPFANPDQSIERLKTHAGPDYLAHRGLAIGYRDLEREDEAMVEVDKALELTPNNPEIWYLKAQIFVEQGKHKESLSWFNKALEKSQQLPDEIVDQIQNEYKGASDRAGQ